MLMTISGGAQKEIDAGSIIKIKPGHLPVWFDDLELMVIRVEEFQGIYYPFVRFFFQKKDDFTGELVTMIDEESALSPDIILP